MKKRVSRKRRSRAPGAIRLEGAVTRLRRSVAMTVSNADAVLKSSDAIAAVSVERTKQSIVRSLLEHEVLAALYGLPAGDVTSALRIHARWLQEQFGLEPVYEPGRELEIPAARLEGFDFTGSETGQASGVCVIKIVAAGWKRNGRVLRKPVATLLPSHP